MQPPMTLADLFCRGEDRAVCNAADAIGAALAERGVRPGDRVAALIEAEEPALAALLGIAAAGCAFVPLPRRGTQEALQASRARLVLAGPETLVAARRAAAELALPVVELRLGEHGLALLDGEPVFEPLAYRADLDEIALAPVDGEPLTHRALIAAAERHPDGPQAALAAWTRAASGERPVVPAA
jgi:acyl-CoA synthetase (AMP-forming)/AMP-acid ligase II